MERKNIDLPENVFLTLVEAHAAIRQWAEGILGKQKMTIGEYHFLRIVQNDHSVTATTLRKRLSATAPTIAEAVKNLEQKGFILRAPDPHDRRIQYITLTSSGRKAVQRARKSISRTATDLAIPSGTLHAMIRDIQTIITALSPS